jgi:hypothetical protein
LDASVKRIPTRKITQRVSQHPWLTNKCREAVANKCGAEGSQDYAIKRDMCADTLLNAFKDYQNSLRQKIAALPKGSKQWWRLNRELLQKAIPNQGVSPLKAPVGEWITEAVGKANVLAQTFAAKSKLPPAADEERIAVLDALPSGSSLSGFLALRRRVACKVLKDLKPDTATGTDNLPARILKRCAKQLDLPVVLLARLLLFNGHWPSTWSLHRICPLYKKGAAHDPSNYRGVHLTPVLSKVIERVIGSLVVPFLERTGAFGENQWAYQKKRSCKDLLALLTARWLHSF